jgi:phage shock protein PspC (stress-responsive transcriptional regulator)
MRGRRVSRFKELRSRLYRSSNGMAMGVFRGIAESMAWSVCLTRWVGVFVLLMLASSVGAHGLHVSIFVAGFFYLLAAMLMQPPRSAAAQFAGPPPLPREPSRPAAPYYQQEPPRQRVDLSALDRQLDALNRRIQSMETIVTDRQYDWDRRMEGK